ncbi:MAG: class I SAM-dependent methyltransferase [Microthrixaceae bacterium]
MTLSSRIASRTFIQKRELMAQSGIDIAFWSAYSRVYDGLLKLGPYADLIADSVDRLKVTNGAVVADLGCGTGNCLNRVISTFGELPNELLGVDTSLQMLDSARRKLGHDPRVKLKEQSLLDWLDDRGVESIDCAVSVNVLYTMQHRERREVLEGPEQSAQKRWQCGGRDDGQAGYRASGQGTLLPRSTLACLSTTTCGSPGDEHGHLDA